MSATGAEDGGKMDFKLKQSDLVGDRDTNPIVRRYESEKRLAIHEDVAHADSQIVEKAAKTRRRQLSHCHFRSQTRDGGQKSQRQFATTGTKKTKLFCDSVAMLTGTMRGLERDELLEEPCHAAIPVSQKSY